MARFNPQVTYGTSRTPEGLSVGDFNGDEHMDLVVSNLFSNTVGVFLGQGDGTFQTQLAFAAGSRPFGIGVGDLNGDGLPDVVVANSNVSTTSILLLAQTYTHRHRGWCIWKRQSRSSSDYSWATRTGSQASRIPCRSPPSLESPPILHSRWPPTRPSPDKRSR